jgi:hypothetical protein
MSDLFVIRPILFNPSFEEVPDDEAEATRKTTDRAPTGKKVLSAVLRGAEKLVEAAGGESGALKSLGGHAETHILGETFYTCVPFLYGLYFAKLAIRTWVGDKGIYVAAAGGDDQAG